MAVAASIGLGIAAFEEDLRAAEFGWRQLVVVLASVMAVSAPSPRLVSALPGRWDLPLNDFSQSVSWMQAKAADGAFRVLWLGDPRALNQGSWAAGDGLAYATSEDGPPDARWLWNAAEPGPAAGLASSVDQAIAGGTDQLGRMLAPSGVRYVVLLTSLAPEISGEQNPQEYPVPAGPGPRARRPSSTSTRSFRARASPSTQNTAWIPERAAVPGRDAGGQRGRPIPGPWPAPRGPASSPGPSRSCRAPPPRAPTSGRVAGGHRAHRAGPGRTVEPGRRRRQRRRAGRPSFGWAGSYRVEPGQSTLRFGGGILPLLIGLYSVLVWVVAAAVLLDRRRRDGEWRLRRRRRRPGPQQDAATDAPVAPEPVQGGAEPVAVEVRP